MSTALGVTSGTALIVVSVRLHFLLGLIYAWRLRSDPTLLSSISRQVFFSCLHFSFQAWQHITVREVDAIFGTAKHTCSKCQSIPTVRKMQLFRDIVLGPMMWGTPRQLRG